MSSPGPSGTSGSSAIVSVAIGQWAVAAAPVKIRTLLGLVRGGGPATTGSPGWAAWRTLSCPTRGVRPTTRASSPTRPFPP